MIGSVLEQLKSWRGVGLLLLVHTKIIGKGKKDGYSNLKFQAD
jgi:hypothetical protein